MTPHLPELPFELHPFGPEAEWTYENGVLTGRAGARQDRFVPPGGDDLDSVSDAPASSAPHPGATSSCSPG